MRKFIYAGIIMFAFISCQPAQNKKQADEIVNASNKEVTQVILKDYGAEPLVVDIEEYTLKNETFRTTIWTGNNLQLTVMSIPVGGEVGLEMHTDIEQFLRIEEGEAEVLMGDDKDNLNFVRKAGDDDAIFVPTGKWHNVINKGDKPLKIYSIYAKPEHPHGTVHKDKAESDAAHHDHHDHDGDHEHNDEHHEHK